MSIEEHFQRQEAEQRKERLQHLRSHLANTEERIGILLDEERYDEAKEELAELCNGFRKVLDSVEVGLSQPPLGQTR